MRGKNFLSDKLAPFVPFPRSLSDDFRSGKLPVSEFLVYCWLRMNTNLLGVAVTSLADLKDDLNLKKANTANKILLSLKKKRYLYYKARPGRRGTFHVHFDEIVLPNKTIKRLDSLFDRGDIRDTNRGSESGEAEPTAEVDDKNQRPYDLKNQASQLSEQFSLRKEIRGCNNDNDKYKEKEVDIAYKRSELVYSFHPNNHQEEKCQKIALALGEEKMDFLLSILSRRGFAPFERAWGIFQELDRGKIDNPRAYFNTVLQNLLDKNGND